MRRTQRLVLLLTLVLAAPAITGCANFDLDKLDVFGLNDKKKLPGDRQPLFPEGVPGVQQGIPSEYMKGHDQNQPGAAIPDPTLTVAPVPDAQKQAAAAAVEEKPAPKPRKKKVVKRTVTKPKPAAAAPVQPVTQQEAPAAWPTQQQQPAQSSGQAAPWPSQSQSTTSSPWPSAPSSGNFSR